eukprot:m.264502 g.264502  ORF g.264502 m.264502 type:complete len:164 (-) comp16232_c0_seq13:2922-3413(-)
MTSETPGLEWNPGAVPASFEQPWDSSKILPSKPTSREREGKAGPIKQTHKARRVRQAVNHGALHGRAGATKLREAVNRGDMDNVRMLVEAGADVNAADDKQRCPIHFCCTKNDHEILKYLIKSKADLNRRDSNGNSPLHLVKCDMKISALFTLFQTRLPVLTI